MNCPGAEPWAALVITFRAVLTVRPLVLQQAFLWLVMMTVEKDRVSLLIVEEPVAAGSSTSKLSSPESPSAQKAPVRSPVKQHRNLAWASGTRSRKHDVDGKKDPERALSSSDVEKQDHRRVGCLSQAAGEPSKGGGARAHAVDADPDVRRVAEAFNKQTASQKLGSCPVPRVHHLRLPQPAHDSWQVRHLCGAEKLRPWQTRTQCCSLQLSSLSGQSQENSGCNDIYSASALCSRAGSVLCREAGMRAATRASRGGRHASGKRRRHCCRSRSRPWTSSAKRKWAGGQELPKTSG